MDSFRASITGPLVSISGETFEELVPKIRDALKAEWGSIRIAYGRQVPFTPIPSMKAMIEEHCLTVSKIEGRFLVTRLNMSGNGTGGTGSEEYVVRQKAFKKAPTVDQLGLF